jgi:predicted nucleotidyltransferase
MERDHQSAYDAEVTSMCERTLVTLIGDIGPWSQRIYLVGGLAPRYIVGALPRGVSPHVGTADVDLVIGLAIDDDAPETYSTLQANLKKSGFVPGEHSFQWARQVGATTVKVEFLCETDQVAAGSIFRPKAGTGSKIGAFNAEGAQLVTRDYLEQSIEAERLDQGGLSRVSLRVANVLSFIVLKIFAFQDRHDNKDSYDLVFTLLNYEGGPAAAAAIAGESEIIHEQQVDKALRLVAERFGSPSHDGPNAYANFLVTLNNETTKAQLRNEAVAVVQQFLTALGVEQQTSADPRHAG